MTRLPSTSTRTVEWPTHVTRTLLTVQRRATRLVQAGVRGLEPLGQLSGDGNAQTGCLSQDLLELLVRDDDQRHWCLGDDGRGRVPSGQEADLADHFAVGYLGDRLSIDLDVSGTGFDYVRVV